VGYIPDAPNGETLTCYSDGIVAIEQNRPHETLEKAVKTLRISR
jgi:hypothetical protein